MPINSSERQKRIGNIPYFGATGQIGWIDEFLFNEELVLLGEDGAPFFDKQQEIAYIISGKSWVNNHAHVLKAIVKITSNKFLYYFLNFFNYEGFINGTTRAKLTLSKLKSIPFLLPPLSEQARIVDVLDGLMNRVSSAQEQLDELSKIEDRLLRAYITNEDNELLPTVKLGGYCQEGRERIGADWLGKRLIGVSKDEGITDLRIGTKVSFENYKIVYLDLQHNTGQIFKLLVEIAHYNSRKGKDSPTLNACVGDYTAPAARHIFKDGLLSHGLRLEILMVH